MYSHATTTSMERLFLRIASIIILLAASWLIPHTGIVMLAILGIAGIYALVTYYGLQENHWTPLALGCIILVLIAAILWAIPYTQQLITSYHWGIDRVPFLQ